MVLHRLVTSVALPVLVILTLAWITSGEVVAGPKKSKRMKPIVAGKAGQRLDEVIQKLDLDSGGFWGSVLVAKGRKVLLCKSYGSLTPDSDVPIPTDALWDWASVSKQFTAAAILRLGMERKLTLDDSIRKFFPAAPQDKQPVTLRHLLNHTSGISNRYGDAPRGSVSERESYSKAFLALPMVSKPGEKWAYNNEAYSLLAAVVEKASNMKFEAYCQKKLFKPAKMTDTAFIGSPGLDVDRVPKDDRGKNKRWAYFDDHGPMGWNYRGMGGVVTSTIDMYKWNVALRGKRILSPAAKKSYYQAGLDDYALGWYVKQRRGDTFYTHGGSVGKHITYYLRTEKSDVVVAII